MALNVSCTSSAFWGDLWGEGWGGTPLFEIGGPLPTYDAFDTFCLCGEATQYLSSYEGVQLTPGDAGHASSTPEGFLFTSDDGTASRLFIDASIGATYSLEAVIRLDNIPSDFGAQALFLGVYDDALYPAGLFISQLGLAFGAAYDGSAYVLADSSSLVSPGNSYAVKIVVNGPGESIYIYWSELSEATAQGGPVLRYVLPLVEAVAVPIHQEGVYLHLQGDVTHPVQAEVLALCLSTEALIDNIPPIADAGLDQAVASCSVIRLDGTKSSDTEGATLTYLWKVIDGPTASAYVDEGQDGTTFGLAGTFTRKLHTMHSADGAEPYEYGPGDVLLFQGVAYTISGTGTDGNGPYIEVEHQTIPAPLTNEGFKLLRQNGFVTTSGPNPTFLPDVAGLFRFQLQVSDGVTWSSPSEVLVNVLETNAPRGIVPEGAVFWNYMSDVAQMLEDGDRIETVWTGLLQVLGAELLHAWEVDYGKSLKDIPSEIARRWLHYEPLMREPFPYLSQVRSLWTGVDSTTLAPSGLALAGQVLCLSVPFRETLITVTLTAAITSPAQLAAYLKKQLQTFDVRFDVSVIFPGPDPGVRIYAPFPFTVVAGTTAPFVVGSECGPLNDTDALVLSSVVVALPLTLQGLPIQADDLFALKRVDGGIDLFRVGSVQGSPGDTFPLQRVLLLDEIPANGQYTGEWAFPLQVSSPQLDFYKGLVTYKDKAVLELVDALGDTVHVSQPVLGVHPKRPQVLALYPDDLYLTQLAAPGRFSLTLWGVYRRSYLPVDPLVRRIPYLQRLIRSSEEEMLRQNLDYTLDTFRDSNCIAFDTRIWTGAPVPRLWAEYTYLSNEETIEANFGVAVGITPSDLSQLTRNVDYLSAVKGLWYAYVRGSRIANLRIGAQVLLALPFAEEAGTIVELNPTYSSKLGRIIIQDNRSAKLVRTYTYPRVLGLEVNPATGLLYAEGDAVKQFAPLVKGVDVVDYVKDPKWILPFLNQGLLKETDKYHRFLVRIDLEAFSLPSLLFVDAFLKRIKPARTRPIFLIRKVNDTSDTVDVLDQVSYQPKLSLFTSPHTLGPWSKDTVDPNNEARLGAATMFDQPAPAPHPYVEGMSGHVVSGFDTDSLGATPEPTTAPDETVQWGFDLPYIRPEAFVTGKASVAYNGIAAMTVFEDIAESDQPLLQKAPLVFGTTWLTSVPLAGCQLRNPQTPQVAMTVDYLQLRLVGPPPAVGFGYTFRIYKNGTLVLSFDVTHNVDYQREERGPAPSGSGFPGASFAVAPGDSIVAVIKPTGAEVPRYVLRAVTLVLGEGVSWSAMGPNLPAGTYHVVRTL